MSVWNAKAGKIRLVAAGWVAMAMIGAAASAQVQTQIRTTRRETSATRRARSLRIIEDTYTHRYEVAGGGGYMRWRSGETLQKNNEVTFWANTTYFLNPKLGITGEVRGAYGNAKINNTIFGLPNPQISEYAFMAGPTYRFYAKEKTAISVFGMGGSALGKFGGSSKGIPETDLGIWPSASARAAFSAGVNLDYSLFPNLAFRASPSYLGTTFGNTLQNNFGLNIGVIYRFGRIH